MSKTDVPQQADYSGLLRDRCRIDKVNTGCTGSNEIFLQHPRIFFAFLTLRIEKTILNNR